MTPDEIRALGPTTTVPIAGACYGLERRAAYELARTGKFPVRVLRLGSRNYRVRTADLLEDLGYSIEVA